MFTAAWRWFNPHLRAFTISAVYIAAIALEDGMGVITSPVIQGFPWWVGAGVTGLTWYVFLMGMAQFEGARLSFGRISFRVPIERR